MGQAFVNIKLFNQNAVFFEEYLAALGADLRDFVQRLIDEVQVLIVYFLEQQFFFVVRAEKKSFRFHGNDLAIVMPNWKNGWKPFSSKDSCWPGFRGLQGVAVSFWDTIHVLAVENLAGKGCPGPSSCPILGHLRLFPQMRFGTGFAADAVPFWDNGNTVKRAGLVFWPRWEYADSINGLQ
jgi:hypothetical protein